jgi:hypothetical protein
LVQRPSMGAAALVAEAAQSSANPVNMRFMMAA